MKFFKCYFKNKAVKIFNSLNLGIVDIKDRLLIFFIYTNYLILSEKSLKNNNKIDYEQS